MIQIKNPDAPATKKQLWKIHELLGVDTTAWKITKKEASTIIMDLQMGLAEEKSNKLIIPEGIDPLEEAKVTIIEGEQRSGKTCTAVAKIADAYFMDCAKNYIKEKYNVDVKVKSYDTIDRNVVFLYKDKTQQLQIPQDYELHSSMRIFANIHLFGIKYKYIPTFMHCLKWLQSGEISYGWLLIDEAHVGINARASMGALQQEMQKQSFQYGKAMLNVILVTHMARMIDWSARTIPTERLSCTFDKKTWTITYTRRKKGVSGTQTVSFYAPRYYPYYWTNERINQ